MPELLIDFLGDNDGMTLIGWASDGFPVYARYGYSNPEDSQSQLKVLTTSYRLKSQADENRPNTLTAILGDQMKQIISINLFQWGHLLRTMNT